MGNFSLEFNEVQSKHDIVSIAIRKGHNRNTYEAVRGPVALIVPFQVGDQNPSRKVHPVSESN